MSWFISYTNKCSIKSILIIIRDYRIIICWFFEDWNCLKNIFGKKGGGGLSSITRNFSNVLNIQNGYYVNTFRVLYVRRKYLNKWFQQSSFLKQCFGRFFFSKIYTSSFCKVWWPAYILGRQASGYTKGISCWIMLA